MPKQSFFILNNVGRTSAYLLDHLDECGVGASDIYYFFGQICISLHDRDVTKLKADLLSKGITGEIGKIW